MGNQIETVRDMMSAIQEEIEQAKSGVLPVDTVRVVFRGRGSCAAYVPMIAKMPYGNFAINAQNHTPSVALLAVDEIG